MATKTNNEIFQAIGRINEGVSGINAHLAQLNGSVAKQQDKINSQDVLNAQMTLTQQQLLTEIKDLKAEKKEKENESANNKSNMNKFWYGILASIGLAVLTFIISNAIAHSQ